MKGVLKVWNNEGRLLLSDHSLLLTVIIAPILYAFFLGTIYINKDIENIPLAVVDMDQSPTSRKIIQQFESAQQVNIVDHLQSYTEGAEEVMKMNVQGFIYFPADFEKNLLKMHGADMAVYMNTTQFLPSNNPNKDIQKILLTINAGVRLNFFETQGINRENAIEMVMPLQPDIRGIANPLNTYGGFLLPGLFILILHQTLLFGIGESLTNDRQKKNLPQVLSWVKGHIHSWFIGKMGFYMLLYMAYFLLFLGVIFPFFQLNLNGSFVQLMFTGLLMTVSVLLFGAFIASFFPTQMGFLEVVAFSSYPFFLMSGFSWPFQAMPQWIELLAQFFPMTPFVSAFTRTLELGAEWKHIYMQLIHLVILSVMYGCLAWFRWHRIAEKQLKAS